MISPILREILAHEGPASIATMGEEGVHLAATWNSYIALGQCDELLIPVGTMRQTEENIKQGSEVQMIIASKDVRGTHGLGAGCLVRGTAHIEDGGVYFDEMKSRFSWARAVMILELLEVRQLI